MTSLDLIIRHANVVTSTGVTQTNVGISEGKIVLMEKGVHGQAKETIEAEGLHLFPGVIDAHVHFNEPGRTEWEGLATGSAAIAAGGGTMFFDMPLNSHPPTITASFFKQKLAAAEAKSLVDFALWGGLVPNNLDKLEELAGCGVIGFKAFMSASGIHEFQSADEATLRKGMKKAAALKLPVAVHAESDSLTNKLAQQAIAKGKTGIRDYLNSRPVEAELEAIRRAISIAEETGCTLHVVHVSSAAGVQLIAESRRRGFDITCETCPHYLALTDKDVEKLGAVAKCAPPLRSAQEQANLWKELLAGNIATIGSDHSPAPPDMKQSEDFFQVWGGISGAQHLLPLLITHAHFERKAKLELIARVTSANVAQRFNLPEEKSGIAIGHDADLALVNLETLFDVRADDLLYRHKQSPYIGQTLHGLVKRTFVRGQTVFKDGKIVGKPIGKLIKPAA